MDLHSQRMRAIAPEADPLRLGCGWSREDLGKPWILVESAAGDSHPGSVHLGALAQHVRDGIVESGGAPALYGCTDACDGITQGTDAMDLSLCIREVLAWATELHARSAHADGLVLLSSCDKAIPGHLIGAARLDLPAIHLPGGAMPRGPSDMSLDRVGDLAADLKRGRVSAEEYEFLMERACPTAGACQFLGTAITMQTLSEALGLALPASALMPAQSYQQLRLARQVGRRIRGLVEEGLTARRILTQQALENALVVHAAVSGSTNALLHLPALAYALGLRCDLEQVQQINDQVPYLLDVRPAGRWTADLWWYAGGVPRVMHELRQWLHLDALTVTGRSVGQNLDDLAACGFFESNPRYLENYGLTVRDVIRPASDPLEPRGGLAILRGNLAPEGAVVKRAAVHPSLRTFRGPARVFDRQEQALEAIFGGRIRGGEAIVIRYEGPRGSGMPEQFYVTKAISSDAHLNTSVVLVTDGRFSGGSGGPCIGHVSPEAAAGGPLAVLQDDDLIEVDIAARRLDMVGVGEELLGADRCAAILADRLRAFEPPPMDHGSGLLGLYTSLAASATEGGYVRLETLED